MTSYLLVSENADEALQEAEKICSQHKVSLHDMTLFSLEDAEGKSSKKSWGIEDVRQLQKSIFLKPLHGKTKAVIVKEAELLTQEAQNALLKALEEPPAGTLLFLLSSSLYALLPTVISRCTIMKLKEKDELTTDLENILAELESLKKGSIPERLKKAEELSKNKEDAAAWLKKAIKAEHKSFQLQPNLTSASTLKQLSRTHRIIKTTNANLRLALEHFFLSISG